jgi:hypothetical protein
MRVAGGLTVAALLAAIAIVLLADPEQPWAVAALVSAIGIAVGAGAIAWQGRARRGRRGPRPRSSRIVRRGIEIGLAAALLVWLRAIDGLSLITAAFVIGTILVGEAVLSARPQSQR